MSKYTTEVRFICENKAGLDTSGGFGDVDDILNKSWDKIFTTKVTFFDENYRNVLCKKILKHYYLREIGSETVGIWLLWMNTRLEEVMPYYNQLYKSSLIEFDPMHNVDLTRKHNRTASGTSKEDSTNTSKEDSTKTVVTEGNKNDNTENTRKVTGDNDTTATSTGSKNTSIETDDTKKDLYSDTPQGGISELENENYLTNARKITDDVNGTTDESTNTNDKTGTDYSENSTDIGTSKETTTGNTSETATGNVNGTTSNTGSTTSEEDFLETLIGKEGGESYSDLLNKYRETFLNIDMQVINEFNDLFFGLW